MLMSGAPSFPLPSDRSKSRQGRVASITLHCREGHGCLLPTLKAYGGAGPVTIRCMLSRDLSCLVMSVQISMSIAGPERQCLSILWYII